MREGEDPQDNEGESVSPSKNVLQPVVADQLKHANDEKAENHESCKVSPSQILVHPALEDHVVKG
jgi:hypothetical protein